MAKKSATTGRRRSAWQPRAVAWLLAAAVLLLGGMEIMNVMRSPSLTRRAGPAGAAEFVLYQKGRAGDREAWLFHEPRAHAGQPVCFQRIDCTEKDDRTGDLRWSFDGLALYAVRRKTPGIDEADHPLWLYEFNKGTLWSLTDEPLVHGLRMQPATEAGLVDILRDHGGKWTGPPGISWYDFGREGRYLFAWQITRWEKSIPQKGKRADGE